VATTIEELQKHLERERRLHRRIGFVPTMGALHDGHASLVRIAREKSDFVVLSIFVNPTQFGPGEDYETYPRMLEKDCETAQGAGVDLVFAPAVSELYPEGSSTRVRVEKLSEPLCGASRPGHFDGVALIVTKLLNIVRPDVSVFGQKDAQQSVIVQRLARDLHLPGEIVIGETVREKDGLAMSSRNLRLEPAQRKAAIALSRGLFLAEEAFEEGEKSGERLVDIVRREIESEKLLSLEYAEIRDLETLEPWKDPRRAALLAVAARAGATRLIDNVFLGGPRAPERARREGQTPRRRDEVTKGAMAIVLAAGEGKRMNSTLPKVLHEVAGEPLLAWVARAARESGVERIIVVVGKGAALVRERFAGWEFEFVEQPERRGTGDAVRHAKAQLERFEGDVLVLAGDVPLLKAETLRQLRRKHVLDQAAVTVLTARLPDPTGYGRIVRREDSGEFLEIVEHKDASPAQRAIDEVNSSIYCFRAVDLRSVLWKIGADNAQKEIYLTDAVGLLKRSGKTVAALPAATPEEILGVNTKEELRKIEEILSIRNAPRESVHGRAKEGR
jgi:pantoate--beta-alanine ligase